MAGQPTIKDVAKLAACSPAVVSTVVNGARGNTVVGAEMRERVLKAAAQLGYRSNFASRSLVRQRTSTFGIYIAPVPWAGLGYAYDDAILRGIESACREQGYDLLLINLTGRQAPQVCLEKFAERRIDGLLLIHVEDEAPWLGELLAAGKPVVAVDYSAPEPGFDAMVFDNQAVSRVAVEHLAGLGHTRIGFAGSCRQPRTLDAELRQRGFLKAMAEGGLEVRPEWVFDHRLLAKTISPDDAVCQIEGRAVARHALALGKGGPTAWIAYNDLVAITMLTELKGAGLSIPRDISLIGVDDTDWCRLVDPLLTSVGHPLEAMGRRAVDRLVERVAQGPVPAGEACVGTRILFPPALMIRDSTTVPGT